MEPKLRTEYKISKEEWLKGYDIYASMFKKKSAYLRGLDMYCHLRCNDNSCTADPYYRKKTDSAGFGCHC